jgi:hypothetical protein
MAVAGIYAMTRAFSRAIPVFRILYSFKEGFEVLSYDF